MAATAIPSRPVGTAFDIHEDVRTEETDIMDEDDDHRVEDARAATQDTEEEEAEEEQEGEDDDEEDYDSSDDEKVDQSVTAAMDKLAEDIPSFSKQFRLIKRIGEGTFSTVYKAEDKLYDLYQNEWDMEKEANKWTSPPLKRQERSQPPVRRSRYVAIKKIYVTSSPARIFNELELLHALRDCDSVCPLITAFRNTDQVVAVLPYFRHGDFRAYFREMTIPDIVIYLRALFTALKNVHKINILHRDIKPTNFLYDPSTQRGVLVDFGLAERAGSESKPCLCHETQHTRKWRQANSVWAAQQQQSTATVQQTGYPKADTRPSRRANRAGTRGFRAPEVLFKCTEQTTAIDIWAAGVILLTILSKRFPFFNSADDVEALIEIATIYGARRMRQASLLHGCVFESTIPTIGQQGFSLEKIILWSTCRGDEKPLTDEEKLAVNFLERCMDLDPSKRITAAEALDHPFLALEEEKEESEDLYNMAYWDTVGKWD